MSVEFKVENRRVLADAVRAAGMEVTASTDTTVTLGWGAIVLHLLSGRAEIRDGQQGRLNELKRQYSRESIKAAAKKAGWSVKWSGDKARVTKIQW